MPRTRTRSRLLTLAILIATALVLAACGTAGDGDWDANGNGDDDADDPGATPGVTELGYVSVTETEPADDDPDVMAGAAFMSFDAELPAGYVESPYEADTCDVYDLAEGIDFPTPPDVTAEPLAAGDEIVLEADGGVYATLEAVGTGGDGTTSFYGTGGTELALPAPDGLTATVPGDEFPAFADAEFPDVAPLELTAPTDTAVTADTAFEWNPAEGDSLVTLTAFAGTTYVSCSLEDDGTFAFADAEGTVAELGEDFAGTLETVGRLAIRSETSGDAVLFLMNGWEQEYAFETTF